MRSPRVDVATSCVVDLGSDPEPKDAWEEGSPDSVQLEAKKKCGDVEAYRWVERGPCWLVRFAARIRVRRMMAELATKEEWAGEKWGCV